MRAELFVVAVFWAAFARAYPSPIDDDPNEDWDERLMLENHTQEQIPMKPLSFVDVSSHVDYYLYTKETANNPKKFKLSDQKLFDGAIDITKPIKILIHGYMSSKDKSFARTVRAAYLSHGHYNVITVDWSELASGLYPTVRHHVEEVGKSVAEFIDKLISQTGYPIKQLHVLGHSLGAHVAGVAGLNVKSGKIMRITGLDPAGPLVSCSDHDRLQPSSAAFVDVIHTCGGGLGFYDSLGSVDFYPNHGKPSQPGCGISLGKCSHKRAAEYYAESLNSPHGFVATKCEHWKNYIHGDCANNPKTYMGEFVSFEARGDYWLKTGSSLPFALGDTEPSLRNSDARRMSNSMLPLAILLAKTLHVVTE